MPTLPLSRYIGPGNDVDSGEALSRADLIAKIHDIKYGVEGEDIEAADLAAIEDFETLLFDGESSYIDQLQSLVGTVGLRVKHLVESYTGQLYPPVERYGTIA